MSNAEDVQQHPRATLVEQEMGIFPEHCHVKSTQRFQHAQLGGKALVFVVSIIGDMRLEIGKLPFRLAARPYNNADRWPIQMKKGMDEAFSRFNGANVPAT